jgi:hypothetical protein
MDIKTLLGDAYKDGMTLDEINAALADKNFVDPTTLPKSVEKTVFDKTASELAKANKRVKELEEANMTADEKTKAEMDKALKMQSDLAKELSKLKAKEIFVTAGLTEADFGTILDAVVSEDEETTKTRAEGFVKVLKSQKEATEKAVKAELLKTTPKPPAGGGTETDDFAKKIEAAREKGDMALVAALIRQQAEANNTTTT